MNHVLAAALALLLAKAVAEITLARLARSRALALRAAPTPPPVADIFPARADYERALDHAAARTRDTILAETIDAAVGCALLAGGMAAISGAVRASLGATGVTTESLAALAVFAVMSLPGLIPDALATFGTEARFGFNRTTPRLWIADKAKGALVSLPLGFLVFTALAWFLREFPAGWWLASAVFVLVFQIVVAAVFPVLLLPLFNKLTPLPEGPLKNRLLALAARAGFPAAAVLVMDGSRRSSRANAFFAGMGRARRIVLFDTLVEKLSAEELEAVLAHEIGHWKRGHILKSLALSAAITAGVFALLGLVARRPELLRAFGFDLPPGVAAPRFGDLMPAAFLPLAALLWWIAPLTNALSRKHEYEADAFAAGLCSGPAPLLSGLKKLQAANGGNPLPHPACAIFHHSHPTLPEREQALTGR